MTRHESDEQNGQRKLIERQGRLADTLLAASEGEALALAPAGLHALPALPGGLAQALRLYRVQAGIRAERVLAGVYPRLRERMEAHQAGSFASLPEQFPALVQADPSGTAVHAALVHSFGWVMLYGGIGVWVLAGFSLLIFGNGKPSVRTAGLATAKESACS